MQKTDKGEGGACVRSGARSHRDGADPFWGCAMNPSPTGTGDRQRAVMMLQTPPANARVAGGGPANATRRRTSANLAAAPAHAGAFPLAAGYGVVWQEQMRALERDL